MEKKNSRPVIVWFRRDLRIHDHAALSHASRTGLPIIPLFIVDRDIIRTLASDGAVFNFQAEALNDLDASLKKLGGRLILRSGKALDVHRKLIEEIQPQAMYFNRDYEPAAIERDRRITELYKKRGILVETWKDSVIHEPHEVLTGEGKHFVVFTPFANAWKKLDHPQPFPAVRQIVTPTIDSESIPGASDLKKPVHILSPLVQGGESHAKKRWKITLHRIAGQYGDTRDVPAVDGTSRMSPYLRFGCISARSMVSSLTAKLEQADIQSRTSYQKFIDELIWREFYQSVLFHLPRLIHSNYRQQFDRLRWKFDEKFFHSWKSGLTGYPLVDAGMRQLNQTGWMHNRVRMVVASFLTKDLLHDWKLGENYFEEKLLDIETASNNGGWQWSASTGVDPKPMRIFNPQLQAERYDPEGEYIRRFIPELKNVPTKFIHAPHEMSPVLQKEVGCSIGRHYPAPIVDHREAAERYKMAYYALKL